MPLKLCKPLQFCTIHNVTQYPGTFIKKSWTRPEPPFPIVVYHLATGNSLFSMLQPNTSAYHIIPQTVHQEQCGVRRKGFIQSTFFWSFRNSAHRSKLFGKMAWRSCPAKVLYPSWYNTTMIQSFDYRSLVRCSFSDLKPIYPHRNPSTALACIIKIYKHQPVSRILSPCSVPLKNFQQSWKYPDSHK